MSDRRRRQRAALLIARRLLWLGPVLFTIVAITFALMHGAPGSPWTQEDRSLPAAVVRTLNERYGLNLPVWQQFLLYLWHVIHLDFGTSLQYQDRTVLSLIGAAWPPTLVLGGLAFLVTVVVGVVLGVLSALHQGGWLDYVTLTASAVGAAVPNFVIGIFLVMLLALGLHQATGGAFYLPTGGFGLDQRLLMPVLTLSAFPVAYVTRLTRASTLDVLREDYVRTAWAKGQSSRGVVIAHVLKNALIPVVTALGPVFGFLITGSVVVESLFVIPGVGHAFITAISARDYPTILGLTILFATIMVLVNLAVDVAYLVLDPRIELQ